MLLPSVDLSTRVFPPFIFSTSHSISPSLLLLSHRSYQSKPKNRCQIIKHCSYYSFYPISSFFLSLFLFLSFLCKADQTSSITSWFSSQTSNGRCPGGENHQYISHSFEFRVNILAMNAQNTPQGSMVESDRSRPFKVDQYPQDAPAHGSYTPGQGSHTPSGPRSINSNAGHYAPAVLNVPARLRGKYSDQANIGSPTAPNPDYQRVPSFPGGINYGMPHMGGRPIPMHERHMSPYSLVAPVPPSVYYPGFVPGAPITPANYPDGPWHSTNTDIAGPTILQTSWSTIEDLRAAMIPYGDARTQNNLHSSMGSGDRTPLAAYMHNPPLQIPQPCPQYQMMKTPSGYIIQDLEALTQQEPPIPRAVPAMWTNASEVTLAKCLENREGITNVYIRGFLPETTDEMLHDYASRFGPIERCKAILDLESGLCKGFAFVQFYNFDSCENCIRGFFYLGYQASFAQKSRNSRLKDLEDRSSTNIYCTNVPITWSEADLRRHFEPYRVVSEKISRDEKTGVSKEVGFARFESREIAEEVLTHFHNASGKDGVKLLLRFADTKAQKLLKQQSNERRAYRAGEYNYSVEVVQGSTPSPSNSRFASGMLQASPSSPMSYQSPIGAGPVWTPATTISPSGPVVKNSGNRRGLNSWPSRTPLVNIENTPGLRGRHVSVNPSGLTENQTVASPRATAMSQAHTPSPKKENAKASSVSPIASHKEVQDSSPKSSV